MIFGGYSDAIIADPQFNAVSPPLAMNLYFAFIRRVFYSVFDKANYQLSQGIYRHENGWCGFEIGYKINLSMGESRLDLFKSYGNKLVQRDLFRWTFFWTKNFVNFFSDPLDYRPFPRLLGNKGLKLIRTFVQ